MSRQYDHYIHQLLEPTDNIITRGKQKRDKEIKPKLRLPDKFDHMDDNEKAKMDDEYLKSKGII